jgi:hypothetical protein
MLNMWPLVVSCRQMLALMEPLRMVWTGLLLFGAL